MMTGPSAHYFYRTSNVKKKGLYGSLSKELWIKNLKGAR
jgi:hypothetical protein